MEPTTLYHLGASGNETISRRTELIQVSFLHTVKLLLDYGHRVVIVTSIPTNGWDPIKRLNKILLTKPDSDTEFLRRKLAIPRRAVNTRQAELNSIVDLSLKQFPELKVIDSTKIFCDTEFCYPITRNGQILYSDRDHLSLTGAEFIFSAIRNLNP